MYTGDVTKTMTDPLNVKVGELLKLTGVTIEGRLYSFAKEVPDPSNCEQRKAFFGKILTHIAEIHADPLRLEKHLENVKQTVEKSTMATNPYKPYKPNLLQENFSFIESRYLQPFVNEYQEKIVNDVQNFLKLNLEVHAGEEFEINKRNKNN